MSVAGLTISFNDEPFVAFPKAQGDALLEIAKASERFAREHALGKLTFEAQNDLAEALESLSPK